MLEKKPVSCEEINEEKTKSSKERGIESDEDTADSGPNISFLALAQRRSEVIWNNVLHPLNHGVFGTPLLLRVVDLDNLTGSELYDLVASRLRAFVPSSALKFLGSGDTASSSKKSAGTTSDRSDEKSEVRKILQKTYSDMEEVAAGPVPRYGFRLRLASRDGRRCSLCPWYECCVGCLVPDDNAPTAAMNGDSIVIAWHFAVDVATHGFGSRTNQVESTKKTSRSRLSGVPTKNHKTSTIGSNKENSGAITLEDCLDAFAEEEKIPEVGSP